MKHLNPTQLARLEELLRARQRTLRGEIRKELLQSDEEHHKDLAGMVEDTGDEAMANLLADLGIAIIDRHVRDLRETEAALARLASGVLGVCSDCAREIDYERLEASPAATRCVRCQERREKAYVHEGTPTL
jgi:RNA polymerase-binding protein DksA